MTSQIRRAGVCVAANIAEGFTRRSSREKIRMLNIAQGSLEECKYYNTHRLLTTDYWLLATEFKLSPSPPPTV